MDIIDAKENKADKLEAEFNDEHLAILSHTNKNKLFCGGSPEMDLLVERGYMEYAGRKSFVPDPYYRLTPKGIAFITAVEKRSCAQKES